MNLTTTSVDDLLKLQVAFKRHDKLFSMLNASIHKVQDLDKINRTLVSQLYLNISTILEEGSKTVTQNPELAVRLLSEAIVS